MMTRRGTSRWWVGGAGILLVLVLLQALSDYRLSVARRTADAQSRDSLAAAAEVASPERARAEVAAGDAAAERTRVDDGLTSGVASSRHKQFTNMPADPDLAAMLPRDANGRCTGPVQLLEDRPSCGPGADLPWVTAAEIYSDYFENANLGTSESDDIYRFRVFVVTGRVSGKGRVPARNDGLFKFPDFGACQKRECGYYLTLEDRVQSLFAPEDDHEVDSLRRNQKVAIACTIDGANTAATHIIGIDCFRMLP